MIKICNFFFFKLFITYSLLVIFLQSFENIPLSSWKLFQQIFDFPHFAWIVFLNKCNALLCRGEGFMFDRHWRFLGSPNSPCPTLIFRKWSIKIWYGVLSIWVRLLIKLLFLLSRFITTHHEFSNICHHRERLLLLLIACQQFWNLFLSLQYRVVSTDH